MNKRGISSQVFVFVMAAVIIAFILIFGIRSLTQVQEAGDASSMAMFKEDMRNRIGENSLYGRNSFEDFSLPRGYNALVFITADDLTGSSLLDEYPLAQEVAVSSDNAFLANDEGEMTPFRVGTISISRDLPSEYGTAYDTDAVLFTPEQGSITVPMSGTGDFTCIGIDAENCEEP